ncbi:MAG: 3-oxosteroid 1-dehydrogenase [Burkholderiaceae bacterium]|nr:3-oxosteroid 1-dehydrogenase [Burkholderiaceae bacterium]
MATAAPGATTRAGFEFDLVVLGSGAAGLAAALVGGVQGARVLLAEKADLIGGTTAMAGGCTWVPANHLMLAAGLHDSAADALEYIRAVAPPGWASDEEPLWQAFVTHAPQMLAFVERHSALRFGLGGEPDPYPDAPGAKLRGRNVSPRPLRFAQLGPWRERIRPSPMPVRLTYNEITDNHLAAIPARAITRFGHRLLWRTLTDRRAMGQAMVAGLLLGCLRHGVTVRTGAAAHRLVIEHGRVGGVELLCEGRSETVSARRGVVIATGGFEWNAAMMATHHPGEVTWTGSPTTNTGDGHRLAEQAGALFARMDQALIMGTRPVQYLGQPHAMPAADYTLPHSMIVNSRGRRFVNELQMNVGLGLDARDPATGTRVNAPAWRIYDAQYAARYRHMLPREPGHVQAGSLRALAAAIGVDAEGLADEAARMSQFARAGRDDDFGRGGNRWDPARSGDPRVRPNPCLGSIERAPFHAFPIAPGFLGTKGGPRTDARGQVLDTGRRAIPGLYCAGNAMANPIGAKAVGAGTTLGPCLTWGYICARSALASDVPSN